MSDRFHHLFIAPADYEASLTFYRDTLGWVVTEDWKGDDGARGAILTGGGVKVVIGERHAGDGDSASRPQVHLDIHDIDKRFAKLPKGSHVVTPPQATHWGTRWFVVRDPDGNLIAFEEVHGRER
jgi:catechol 2,3-dioxygenase-like lactoylglutathione lyase family enzyme